MRRFSAWFWIVVVLASAAAGALYGMFFDDDNSPLRGALFGICIGTLATMHERGIFLGRMRENLRSLPTLPYFLAAEAALLLVVLVGMVVAGSLCWLIGLGPETLAQSITPSKIAVVYSLMVCAIFIFVLRMRDLLGAEMFANFMLGRYHRPVREERVFLFLDLVGSTSYAEAHGDLATQELLRSVFAAIAEPVRRHRGQVDDYVGDQIVVSWPMLRGIEEARCIGCVFAIHQALDSQRQSWISTFGLAPRLRAALHGGSVVAAEVGVDRHKIAYFGDVMNTTARLEGLCRDTGRSFLISDTLLSRMPVLPQGVEAELIGEHQLRGRSESIAVYALEAAQQPAAKRAAHGEGTPRSLEPSMRAS